jgi:hypothetical protein
MIRKIALLILLVGVSLSLPSGAKRVTQGFKIAKMRLDPLVRFEGIPPQEITLEIRQILEQPFRYLGKGAQCYAFVSEDGQFVLKLFRFDQRHLFRPKQKLFKRPMKEKLSRFSEGCRLATTRAFDETGLIYLHLNPSDGKLPILQARAPLFRPVSLPLDFFRFALQKKAEPLLDAIQAAQERGELNKYIDAIVALLEKRIHKEIGNSDSNLWRNFGFLEGRAIEIDFGNYTSRPDFVKKEAVRVELERYMRPLRVWLEKNAPESLPFLNSRLERES